MHVGGQLLLRRELAVRRAGRMDDEAAHVADVGHVAVQLECLDEALAGFQTALDLERQHRAEAPTAAQLPAPLVPAVVRQPGVVDRQHLTLADEVLGDLLGVLLVPFHAQAERLDPLQDQEGVERRDRRADVAEQLHPRLDRVGAGAERRPVRQTVIARVRLGEAGEAPGRR